MSRGRFRAWLRMVTGAALMLTLTMTACGGDVAASASAPPTRAATSQPKSPSHARSYSYVALGDSWAYGGHCGNCKTFIGRYADKLNQRLRNGVMLTNLTENGGTSGTMLAELRHDEHVRKAVAAADIIVIETGVNDLDELGTLDAVAAGNCGGRDGSKCLRAIGQEWRTNFQAIADEIDRLRGGKPTALRLVTSQNVFVSDPTIISDYRLPEDFAQTGGRLLTRELRDAICDTARRHHARCVDVGLLFNGPRGDRPRDENTEWSHEQVARALVETGLAELKCGRQCR